MRNVFPCITIAAALAVGYPAMAGEAHRGALDLPAQVIIVADEAARPVSEPAPAKAAGAAKDRTGSDGAELAEAAALRKAGADKRDAIVLESPADADQVPVLKHIAGTGAKLLDLGSAHGLRIVSARQGEQFMLLQVAPDGEAVVSGPQFDLSVATLMTIAGGQVTELGELHGLRGLYLRNGPEFQVLYATPDGEATIAGVMWDSGGKNLTREQVTKIDGAVPTVVVGKDPAPAAQTVLNPALDVVEKTAFGLAGNAGAPRVWMFVDPLCSYSVRALQELKPYVEQGRIELALIPIAILDYEDRNRSTPAALSLLSKAPDRMAEAWSHRQFDGVPSAEASVRLRTNMAASEEVALRGTPTLIWRKADGREGRIDGLPNDWSAVLASIDGDGHAGAARYRKACGPSRLWRPQGVVCRTDAARRDAGRRGAAARLSA